VLAAAGHPVARRREGPAGLTAREIQVLRLLARGQSSKAIADALVITHKTARNHIQHIYEKAGISNRAQASLFAVSHGLMSDLETATER
jgi:DNA-binding CsgD family transcriptional regulator